MKWNTIKTQEPYMEPRKGELFIEVKASLNNEAVDELFMEAERNHDELLEAAQEEQDRIEQQNVNKIWGHTGPRIS